MKEPRIIFTDNFYRLCAVVLSQKFKEIEKRIHDKYRSLNYPIPSTGFNNYSEYRSWLKQANMKHSPGKVIDETLKQFKLDTHDEDNRYVVTSKLFLGKYPWQITDYKQNPIKLVIKGKGDDKQIWVKIEPWTKKSDYTKLWETIKNLQKIYPDYRSKEKFKKTFRRDFEVYQLYNKTKLSIKPNDPRFEDVLSKMADTSEYHSLARKFKDGNIDEQIRGINSWFNSLLKDLDL